jgi:hypothetical protein
MSQLNITPDQILDAVQRVPVQRWGEVLHAIERLQESPPGNSASAVGSGTDLRGSDLIGIWAERSDVSDSQEFARGLRHQAEHRNTRDRSDAAGQ